MSYRAKLGPTKLSAFRERWDLSQHELAVALGYTVATVYRWEAAGYVPPWFEVWALGYEEERTTGDATTLDTIVPPLPPFNLKPYGG